MKILVAPSLLSADAARLGEECARAEEAGADLLHLDIMDGHFVPNLTFGPHICAAVRKATRLPIVAHLMVDRPEQLVDAFLDAGADAITVHVESPGNPLGAFERVRAAGRRAGVALRPATPPAEAEAYYAGAGLVLVMTVNPGFGGQSYIPGCVGKLDYIRQRAGAGTWLEVDGGITDSTAPEAVRAGANCLVAGTYLFRAPDMAAAIGRLRAAGGGEA
jgi:ribulose-phosphate 3-epimerase